MAMDLDEPLDAEKGEAALRRLRDADPALYLSPSADLAAAAREASKHLYASLVPFSPAQPPPLSNLLAGPAFDAEQIWSQIELLSRPLIPHLRRQLRRLEQQSPSQPPPRTESKSADAEEEKSEEEEDGEGDEELELDDVDDEEESEEEDEEEEIGLEGKAGNQVEDEFFKIKDLDKFMVKGEEAEYGGGAKQGKKKKKTENWMEEDSDSEDEEYLDEDEDNEDEEDDDEHLDLEDFDDDDEEEEGAVGDIIICLKLDALSHFHFAPKPVIEDMSIQANVPALAMEEIAPVAVSDAAMLAPEEIFEGKGDVKEEAELTQAERKRRRANKKRRYADV
uniref:Uncharacterized protein n=1 Tax=Oryza meridionalis TaxID=40149 RepID=A0A0E0F2B2_9ORYZ